MVVLGGSRKEIRKAKILRKGGEPTATLDGGL